MSKTSGPDCIPVMILKNCEPNFSYILGGLFNMCQRSLLLQIVFFNCLATPRSTLGHYRGDSLTHPMLVTVRRSPRWSLYLRMLGNHCPVSPLFVVSKVFEKLVNRFVDLLEKCGLRFPLWFILQLSFETQLHIYIYIYIYIYICLFLFLLNYWANEINLE